MAPAPTAAAAPPESTPTGWVSRLRWRLDPRFRSLEACDRAIATDAGDAGAWVRKAETLRELARHAESEQALERAISVQRDDRAALRWQARALRLLERHEEAVGFAARAVAAGGGATEWIEYAACLQALADAQERASGRPSPRRDDVLSAFRRATECDPGNASAWEGGGAALLAAGRPEDAVQWFERAIALDGARPEPWLLKGQAFLALGREADAADALQRGTGIAWLGSDRRGRVQSPLEAIGSLARPVVAFVWSEKRGVALTVILYLLGLVVWSLNAARRDLGFGVAADLQYLVAGLAPAFVLALALAMLVAWLKIPAWSRDRLFSWRPAVAAGIASAGSWLAAGGVLAFAIFGWTGVLDRLPALAVVAYGAVAAGFILAGLTREENWLFRLIWYGYAPVAIAALALAAFVFYADGIYPRLPQSLGGGKPRCAQLDLETASISAATLGALAPAAPAPHPPVVRTASLEIVFAQGDTLFVKRPGDARLLELRGGSVRAVVGCD